MKKQKVSTAKKRHSTNVTVPASKERHHKMKFMTTAQRVKLPKRIAHFEVTKDITI